LKRHLEMSGLERVDTFGIKDLFRVGFEQGLILDPAPWFDYLKKRNLTSHTYDEETAQTVFATARLFLPDAKNLFSRLKERNRS
ncbi:MAG: nucleotidyltransferase substrate binding protein, partial [Deltaproteobacteria bacterium]|nr:nucleotidyltransferase substrate binding protein [Deltaproteobacteria bacterium]